MAAAARSSASSPRPSTSCRPSWTGSVWSCPHQCDGYSLSPFLQGQRPKGWRQEAHWEYDFSEIATLEAETELELHSDQCTLNVIRDDKFKYVHFTALPPLFFDLEKDPGQFRNVAQDPAYAGTYAGIRAEDAVLAHGA